MAGNPNKISQFWKELKRRNVVRVITVYAGAAFVLLELVDIIAEPFGLPDWTLVLVVILLVVGLIVAVILSWIYDIHPEGGMVRTAPADQLNREDTPPTSNGWKIASYISFVVIVGLIVLNIFPRTGKKEIFDKSIAVLPFKYLSDDPDKQYLADGIMDEILLNLSKIGSLRIPARTSVEQYRETDKTATEICRELDIAYLLEGSFMKNGDQVRLIVQLIEPGKEGHVWAKNYDRSWEDIFNVQSEVAQLVARELQAIIAPEEQRRIEISPTADPAAYEVYLRANARREEFIRSRDQSAFDAAVELYNTALAMDSAFARAYSGLASIYYYRYGSQSYFDETFLDTFLYMSNKAIQLDDQLAEAYYVRARYFMTTGDFQEADANLNKALELDPNYAYAYAAKGVLLYRFIGDYQGSIKNYQKALSLVFGEERLSLLRNLITAYTEIGMIDLAKDVLEEKLDLDGDSVSWLSSMAWIELSLENYEEAYRLRKKAASLRGDVAVAMDYVNCLPPTYKDEYFENVQKLIMIYNEQNRLPIVYAHRLGYGFYLVGNMEEADRYFQMQIRYGEESIRLGRSTAQRGAAQYDLAATYAFTGRKDKAYKYLREFASRNKFPLWWVSLLKNDPLFNPIRDEPEFQQIAHDVESKYQAEHDRVEQLLEDNHML